MPHPKIELYYGYVESEDGIHHAFEVVDPDACADDNEMKERLANMLFVSPDDPNFNFNSIYLDIPQSVTNRIKNKKEAHAE